ncbi:hypothetical protein K466DRAFT_269533 [Polyporus arcularius HHB13444]|uniref:Uncharacterized protein n=1 Tax=Polyporus arcularius HHB13444 TaxID=1314778 RepID=A0A5C3PR72_9APHY|nr:hypothetical protein K466DRAFT_269533 [Polyporus arcularius HHB13444]
MTRSCPARGPGKRVQRQVMPRRPLLVRYVRTSSSLATTRSCCRGSRPQRAWACLWSSCGCFSTSFWRCSRVWLEAMLTWSSQKNASSLESLRCGRPLLKVEPGTNIQCQPPRRHHTSFDAQDDDTSYGQHDLSALGRGSEPAQDRARYTSVSRGALTVVYESERVDVSPFLSPPLITIP